ncbi:MAG: hypothetical protein ACKVQJ_00640 [Pyrinomonadaceae bacterium]
MRYPRTEKYLGELKAAFVSAKDKHEANYRSSNILAEMSGDSVFFAEILEKHLRKRGSLNTLHYPVVGIDIELNEYFGLVANCWIPLPDKASNISTKSIHHHGDMLLSTVTAYGTGYEHWMFETPVLLDPDNEIYELKLLERADHPLNHVAFVDAYIAHLPLYPPDLTVTYALWSSRFPTTWKDRIKRMPILSKNSARLRKLATHAGLAKQLELKLVEYFDFYPCNDGFRGIREREEFKRTNNEDYLASLFHIIQETGNDRFADIIMEKLDGAERIDNPNLVRTYIADLAAGNRIEGRVSPDHYGVDQANFSADEILAALEIQDSGGRSQHSQN